LCEADMWKGHVILFLHLCRNWRRAFTVNWCERRKQYFLYDVFGVVGEIVYSCILVDPCLGC
jgi:hypothetical protein